jgi:hypothetical protein
MGKDMGAAQSCRSTQDDVPGWEKVYGIQLPGQSGKTRKMEDKITEYMTVTRNDDGEDDFNIMITSNSKLLVEQSTSRLDGDLGPDDPEITNDIIDEDDMSDVSGTEYAVLKNGASTWTSSNKTSVSDIVLGIIEDEISMIVCCANVPRFKKIIAILEYLEKSKNFKGRINLWLDEAHKYIKLLRKDVFNRILAFRRVARVCLVSASWDPIDKYYSIPRITYQYTHPDVYRSLHECEWRIIQPDVIEEETAEDDDSPFDMSSGAPGYIRKVFDNRELAAFIEQPGKHWLISGNSRTVTHDAIAVLLVERGWNGLILNGKDKVLRFANGDADIDYVFYNKQKLEPKDVLEGLFNDYPELHDAPFFITGLNCIKEGITFQGPAFMLDGAVLPDISSPSDAYQLGCRLNGNLKGMPIYAGYSKPLVVTSSRMEKKIKKQENIAIYLPRILYEAGINLPSPFLKRQAARGKVSHDIKGLGYRIFKDYHTFKCYIDLLGRRTHFSDVLKPGETLHSVSVQSTRGGNSMPRYLTEVIDKIDLAYGGGGGIKTGFPCYLDITKPETLVWVAVVADLPDIKKRCANADRIYPDESLELLPLALDYSSV